MLFHGRADHAQSAGIIGAAVAHLVLLRHIVKVDPLALTGRHNALGAQNHAVNTAVQRRENALDLAFREHLHRLHAPAGEHLVSVMMVVVVTVAATAAMLIMFMMMVVMLMLVVVVVMAALTMFVVMLMFLVAAAVLVMLVLVMVATALLVLMLMVMATALLVLMMVVMLMVMLVAAAGALLIVVVMMVVVLMRFMLVAHGLQQFIGHGNLLHCCQNGLTVDLIPRRGNNGGIGVLFTQ